MDLRSLKIFITYLHIIYSLLHHNEIKTNKQTKQTIMHAKLILRHNLLVCANV